MIKDIIQRSITTQDVTYEPSLYTEAELHFAGYGGRQTTEECPEAILLMSVQERALNFRNSVIKVVS